MSENNVPSFSNTPRSRRPFMQLDLQNVPKSCNKLTFQQQCYKLVPDLSPVNQNLSNSPYENISDQFQQLRLTTNEKTNIQHRRRMLPTIPVGKRPLEKLWQKEMNRSNEVIAQSLSNEMSSTLNSVNRNDSIDSQSLGLRWTRKLSSNMLLEIESDPQSGRALSLRLLTDEDSNRSTNHLRQQRESTQSNNDDERNDLTQYETVCVTKESFTNSTPSVQVVDECNIIENNTYQTNASDSGISSNMQSPTVSSNSDGNNDFTESTPKIRSTPKTNSCFLRLPDATHRALYKFCARHSDEIDLEIGDAIHVEKEYDDQWSDGINIRTGERGIFPSSLVTDVDYSQFAIESASHIHLVHNNLFNGGDDDEFDRPPLPPSINFRIKRERYLLDFLGSVEVNEPKGDAVINEAINRISLEVNKPDVSMIETPCLCVLEISDLGLRMMENGKHDHECRSKQQQQVAKTHRIDYFFTLLQITYCGYRLMDEHYYFAFITRHPSDRNRFASHVFRASDDTRDVAEAMGRAFHRFYNRFVEITLPLETFYLDD